MARIVCDTTFIEKFVSKDEINSYAPKIKEISEKIQKKEVVGSEMLGWLDLPSNYDRDEFQAIKEAAAKIHQNCEIFIVIGIGGSYLGARAVIEALQPNFPMNQKPKIIFAGNNLSGKYLADLLKFIEGKEICLNVISKSGTTTEPAVAFRILRRLLIEKYGENAKDRIFVTTDKNKGALKELADQNGYQRFVVPDDIGGRYSVLSAVGLLPIAVAGIDLDELMAGAAEGQKDYTIDDISANPAYLYAAIRNILYQKGKKVELLANYEPNLHYLAEWWKQLFGESEGKDGKGIFPASVDFTTDLHSLGQYIQEGERQMLETVIYIKSTSLDITIEKEDSDLDELNYLAGKTVGYANEKALQATATAHTDGGVPNIILELPDLSTKSVGNLIYFFEAACMMSAYLLGANPFNQSGVEAYKNNMFKLLGKPTE